MGCKRPNDNEVPELRFKHSKVSEKESIQPLVVGTADEFTGKRDISVWHEGCVAKCDWRIGQTKVAEVESQVSPEKDAETSAPLSWVTTGSSDGEPGYDSLYPEFFEFDFSRRRLELPPEDIYAPLTDAPPRKEVPVGPNYQATLPDISTCTLEGNESGEKFVGNCIIPMFSQDLSSTDAGVGVGRIDCFCLDEGSIRCVRQHVMEAREKLKKEFGEEVFWKLGFYEMGEVVAAKWSVEEQQLFHQVVFSNPYFLDRNFWKQLSATFPSRSKKEIVSYYFNVFMLGRRAAQNRLDSLEIDSDDDEWHGNCGNSYETEGAEEDEDSGIGSPPDVKHCEETFPNEGDDDSDADNYSNNDCDGDLGNCVIVANKNDCGMDNSSDASTGTSSEKVRANSVGHHVNETPGGFTDYFGIRDDSGSSFEFNMDDSCGTDDSRAGSQSKGNETYHTGCLSTRMDDFSNGANHPYMFDACDAKIWDARYQGGPSKDFDLLPTSNIIEEIFGQGSWDDKPLE